MSLTAYPTLRLKLTLPQALKLQFLPAVPGTNAQAAADRAEQAAEDAQQAAADAVNATAGKVNRSGDTMTGMFVLAGDPTVALGAATKQYVDAHAGFGADAPSDGTIYGRRNATWTAAQPLDGDLTSLAGATATNQWYYRSGPNTWSPVTVGATMTFSGGVLNTTAGGGNVIADGVPLPGQWARWTSAATIEGIDAANTGFQPLDADLTSIAGLSGTNTIYYRSAANTWSPVTMGGNMTFSGGVLNTTAGGGNVIADGIPLPGQLARWTSAATIEGIEGTQGSVIYRNGTQWTTLTPGAAGQVLTTGGTGANPSWTTVSGGGGASVTIADTPPASPAQGNLWWESDTGALWISYNDGNTTQWVSTAPQGGGNVSSIPTPVDDQVAVWTDATHIEGTSGLTFSASGVLTVSNAGYNIVLNPAGGGNVNISASGTPTDVGMLFSSKGGATCNFYTHEYGSIVAVFGQSSISNSNSFVQMWGALNGTPTIAGAGGTPNGTVNIQGTTTNDNAPSGYIGEYIEAGSSGEISSATWTAITAITLTPGDWDVWGNTYTNPSGAGLLGAQIYSAPNTADGNTRSSTFAQTPGAGGAASCPIPPVRISISASTTYWMNCYSSNGGSVTAYIAARRVR